MLATCSQKKEIEVQRSFYYWRSVFKLSDREKNVLDSLSIKKLYTRFFDVEWNTNSAKPVAQIIFKDSLPSDFTSIPVVFITNEAIRESTDSQIDSLSAKIVRLVENIIQINHLKTEHEIQIDCDWTKGTKEKYFRLLNAIKKERFMGSKKLSATIRLHQLKFLNETGVPPVDKGLLMCYNMGNIRDPRIKNSILDVDELKKYTGSMGIYPLVLDIALPVFEWYVWFRDNKFKGLIHSFNLKEGFSKKPVSIFQKDTIINGYAFLKNDWLRYEGSIVEEIKKVAEVIKKKYSSEKINVVLYHLDEFQLKKYTVYEMEGIFNSFH